ncbi:MAG: VWA domain-containing protein [Paracoccaceae bacterium]
MVDGALGGLIEPAIGLARPWALLFIVLPLAVMRLAPPSSPPGALSPPPGVVGWLFAASGRAARLVAGAPGALPRLLGWISVIVALAGPELGGAALVSPSGRDVLFAIDLSASMSEQDMVTEGQPESRSERMAVAREEVGRFLASREGDRVGLIGFATDAYLISPLTHDVSAAAAMLDELTVGLPGRRTDLGQAIGLAAQILRTAPKGERMLIVLTDGEANAGDLGALDAADIAAAAGISTHLIGFAGEVEPKNAAFMREIAERANGAYHEARDPESLAAVAAEIEALAPLAAPEAEVRLKVGWSAPFLGFGLLCAGVFVWLERRDA